MSMNIMCNDGREWTEIEAKKIQSDYSLDAVKHSIKCSSVDGIIRQWLQTIQKLITKPRVNGTLKDCRYPYVQSLLKLRHDDFVLVVFYPVFPYCHDPWAKDYMEGQVI